MLILCRTIDQEVIIGENISIRILGRSGNRISVGICAPHEVSVSRAELSSRQIEPRHRNSVLPAPLGPCSAE